jgi:AcrR family transcriptional regulator
MNQLEPIHRQRRRQTSTNDQGVANDHLTARPCDRGLGVNPLWQTNYPRTVVHLDQGSAMDAKRADPRYQRLMEATRAASRDGYEAVSMRELAESCRLSMKTIYKFCRSKDQLIAEAHLDGMLDFRSRVAARPPVGATAQQRVQSVVLSFANSLEVDELRSRAMLRALYSLDAEAGELRARVGESFATIINAAIGETDVGDRRAVIHTLAHVMDSVIGIWLAQRGDGAWVRRELELAVRALLRD